MSILIIILLMSSLFLFCLPCLFWFMNNLAKTKGEVTFAAKRRLRISWFVCYPIAIILIIIVVIMYLV